LAFRTTSFTVSARVSFLGPKPLENLSQLEPHSPLADLVMGEQPLSLPIVDRAPVNSYQVTNLSHRQKPFFCHCNLRNFLLEHSLFAFVIDIYKVPRKFYGLFVKKFIFAISVDISNRYMHFDIARRAKALAIFAILKFKK